MAAGNNEVAVRVRLRERARFTAESKKVKEDIRSMGREAEKADGRTKKTTTGFATLWRVMQLMKPASLIVAMSTLAQIFGVAASGAVALTAALAPTAGALVGLGAFALTGAAAMGIFKFAMSDLTKAVGGLNEEMDWEKMSKLTSEAQKFGLTLNSMKPSIIELQRSAQRGLFPGLDTALKTAAPQLKTLNPLFEGMGRAMGDVATQAAKSFSGKAWTNDLPKLGVLGQTVIRQLGSAGIYLANAFRNVLLAARPMITWLARGINNWAKTRAEIAATGRASGTTAAFFRKTMSIMSILGSILSNVWGIFKGVGRAAFGTGKSLMLTFDGLTERANRWVNSVEGQRQITKYFKEMEPVIEELGRLVLDLGKSLFHISRQPGVQNMINVLRTQLLPAFVKVSDQVNGQLGPAFVNFLVQFMNLVAAMSSGTGVLTVYVTALSAMATGMVWLIKNVPGLGTALSTLLVISTVSKLWMRFFMLLKTSRVAMLAWTAVATAGRLVAGAWTITMGLLRAAFVAQTGVTNASTLAMVRWRIATLASAAASRVAAIGMAALMLVMSVNPIVLIIGALVALGAAFIVAYNKIGWFRDGVNTVWSWIKTAWPVIFGILTGPVGLAVGFIIRKWDSVKSAASSTVGWVKARFGDMISFIQGMPGKIAAVGRGIWDGLKGGLISVLNWAIDKINGLIRAANKLPLVDIGEVDHIGGGNDGPRVGGQAMGGVMKRTGWSVTGEKGPELQYLRKGTKTFPSSMTRQLTNRTESIRPLRGSDMPVLGSAPARPITRVGRMGGGDGVGAYPLLDRSRVIRVNSSLNAVFQVGAQKLAEVVATGAEDAKARE